MDKNQFLITNIKKYEEKIKGLNRWLSRAKVGSKNRYKIKKKLNILKYFIDI